jgi:hypothetical protein
MLVAGRWSLVAAGRWSLVVVLLLLVLIAAAVCEAAADPGSDDCSGHPSLKRMKATRG